MNSKTFAARSRSSLLLLALIVALAAALRIFNLSALGFWTDELGAMSASGGWGLGFATPPLNCIIDRPLPVCTRLSDARPITQIIPGLIRDESHPPIYFMLLRLWRSMFGDSEIAVRSLNVLFSLVAIPLLFFAAVRSIGSTAALWACLLMAVASPQITFAQESRNYMAGMTFSLAALVCLQRLMARPSIGRVIAFATALLAMMLTHIFVAGAGVAIAIYAAVALRGRSRQLAITGMFLAAVIFLLIWGVPLYRQLPNFHSNYRWLTDDGPGHLYRWFFRLCRVPLGLVADSSWRVSALFGLAFLWLPIAYIHRPQLRVWILWLICSIALIAGLDLVRSTTLLTLPRYLLFATPAAYVLIAAAVRGRWSWIIPSAAVIAAILALPSAYIPPWKIDYRTPVQVIGRRLAPQDGLVIIGADPVLDGVTYAAFQHYLPAMPAISTVLTAPPDPTLLAGLHRCPHLAIVQMWPDRFAGLPGFKIEDEQTVPYFADVVMGRFDK